jgi:uncharacterized protein (TIGR01244 family)
MISLKRAFAVAVLLGALGVLANAAVDRYRERSIEVHALTPDISVTAQLRLQNIAALREQGFRTIIDLRPDGEAPDQAPSASIKQVAERAGFAFAFVPVPHGDIPAASVDALSRALIEAKKPVLLYCRTGRRAARTWALVEAQRPGGLDAAAIELAVKNAGQSAEDLDGPINAGVSARVPATP